MLEILELIVVEALVATVKINWILTTKTLKIYLKKTQNYSPIYARISTKVFETNKYLSETCYKIKKDLFRIF